MLESLYWQIPKGADYLQFLCDIDPGINAYYLENEIIKYDNHDEDTHMVSSFVRLRSLGSGIDFNYRYGNGNDFFIYHLGLEEH